MPTVNVTAVTGQSQYSDPDGNLVFFTSGYHSGDSISIVASGAPNQYNINVIDSGQSLSITGFSSGDNITVSILEGITGAFSPDLPTDTRFFYSGDGKLIQKTNGQGNTFYTYTSEDFLSQVIAPLYTKDLLYNNSGFLTGYNII